MSLSFKQQVIKDPQGKIKYKLFRAGGREHYRLGVWLDGSDDELDKIERVEYLLDPTFKRPNRSSSNRGNKFSITFWTWGMFTIRATIYYKGGTTEERQHLLSYELPVDNGENYVLVQ